jgi:hypothetical protein
MTRACRERLAHAYFRAVRRWMEARTGARQAQLYRLANAIAERLAGHDRPNLFGGI